MKRSFNIIAAFGSLLICCVSLRADVKPAALFGDHMVVQRDKPIPVWGTADSGEAVTVSILDQKKSTTAGADGKWMVRLDPIKSDQPVEMTIAGKNSITIKDVLVGEVWLASGQSNMEFSVSKKVKSFAGTKNEDEEIAAADHPQIRMFNVPMKLTADPQADVVGEWKVCSPETVPAFSAVGYFFARELNQNLKLPIGIINSSYGASTAQCWISDQAMRSDPRFKQIMDDYDADCAKWDAAHPAGATTQPAPSPAESTTRPTRGRGAPKSPRDNQHNPSLLWNAQLKPLEPYAIRGAIWYQGESVVGGTELYLPLMQTLISSWRKEWNEGDFPFLFVQLASYKAPATQPAPGGTIAKTREAQLQTLTVPNTAMAVTIDIGDAKNVHPKDKQDVGKRLGLAARATVYGEKVEFSGPIFDSMKLEGSMVRLRFTHTQGGLSAKGDKLAGFAIAGENKKFVSADAKIDGDSVILSSPDVAQPAAVRYGWADNPPVNLFNGEGLPASPFRTDQW